MSRNGMLTFLYFNFDKWEEVRDFMIGVSKLNDWYPLWEGELIGDFSFCSEDPRSDNYGETITQSDFEAIEI